MLKGARPQAAIFHAVAGEARFALCVPLPQSCASCVTLTGTTQGTGAGGRTRCPLFRRGAGAWGRSSAGRFGHRPSGFGRVGRESLQARPRTDRHRHQNHHGKRRAPCTTHSGLRFVWQAPVDRPRHRSGVERGHAASPFVAARCGMSATHATIQPNKTSDASQRLKFRPP
jgi:hypothetical protein